MKRISISLAVALLVDIRSDHSTTAGEILARADRLVRRS
jgi:hypothetical protein